MKLMIDEQLSKILPDFTVVAYTMTVVNQFSHEVEELLRATEKKYQNRCDLLDVVNLPKIQAARDGYKKLKKDPSRYRLATEALLRRIIRGISLYRLGDLIDLGNILSVMTERSICVVDLDKINGDILIRIGNRFDHFEAINRGLLNIDRMPVYTDDLGPFGTPSSDTNRTAVDEKTRRLLVMMICFHHDEIETDEALLVKLYQDYALAQDIKKIL